MSKVTIAFASFVVGVLTSLALFSGSHASILAQAPPSQTPTPQASPLIASGDGLPTVPPIKSHFERFGLSFPGGAFGVDGAECVRCVFNGITLRYGGGEFKFTDFTFSGPLRIEFVGAAKNTLLFLQFVQQLAAGQAPPPNRIQPNTPMLRTEKVNATVTGSFGIPE